MKAKEKIALSFCKILKVLNYIGLVGITIGAVCILAIAVFVPVLGSKLSIGDGKISYDKYAISYSVNENNDLVIDANGEDISISENDLDLFGLTSKEFVDALNKINVKSIIYYTEIIIIYIAFMIIIAFLVCKFEIGILKDIIQNKTAITENVANGFYDISKIILISFIVTAVLSMVCEVIMPAVNVITVNGSSLITAAIMYIAAWAVSSALSNSKKEITE